MADEGHEIVGCKVLSRHNPVKRLQRKLAPAMQEIRKMRLPEPGLAGQQRNTKRPPIDPAQQFQAQSFMHLGKVHV